MDFIYKSSERIGTWIDFVPVYISPSLKEKIERILNKNLIMN